jgi:hypothetical protein
MISDKQQSRKTRKETVCKECIWFGASRLKILVKGRRLWNSALGCLKNK